MRVLVLGGAGAVCSETTRDLVSYSNFEEIVVAEFNMDAANALVEELNDKRLKTVFVDANDYSVSLTGYASLAELVDDSDTSCEPECPLVATKTPVLFLLNSPNR